MLIYTKLAAPKAPKRRSRAGKSGLVRRVYLRVARIDASGQCADLGRFAALKVARIGKCSAAYLHPPPRRRELLTNFSCSKDKVCRFNLSASIA